jgi:hypothetical protein
VPATSGVPATSDRSCGKQHSSFGTRVSWRRPADARMANGVPRGKMACSMTSNMPSIGDRSTTSNNRRSGRGCRGGGQRTGEGCWRATDLAISIMPATHGTPPTSKWVHTSLCRLSVCLALGKSLLGRWSRRWNGLHRRVLGARIDRAPTCADATRTRRRAHAARARAQKGACSKSARP